MFIDAAFSPGSLSRMRNVKTVPAHQAEVVQTPGVMRLNRGEGDAADMDPIVFG
ncbi:hypothetical protein Airi01_011800 [Actinoallomurus iriomotensis]|uniref:Uncharacterized protein n=1 Tax=Actinoallomurus iriomotensis TaxID=478107 RepID=A0A9W6RC19_9ACTN|nr:hypothetical protein Airi01_011800 [Actinoallomurus iriomotensis]